jgi:hypothetical protein
MTTNGGSSITTYRMVTKSSRRRRKRPRIPRVNDDRAEETATMKPKINNTLLEQLRHREVFGSCSTFATTLTKRRIAFRELQTPPSEAVLGLDETGSYIFGVEARRGQLHLVQRGIPARRGSGDRGVTMGAPLVKRIPLPCEGLSEGDSLVATVPIDILQSGPTVAVIRIQTHQSSQDDGEEDDSACIGTIILCHLGTGQTESCPKVRLGNTTTNKGTIRNLLWKVNAVPLVVHQSTKVESSSPWCCREARQTPAHLLLNDEDDGYRLTWIVADDYGYHCIEKISTTSTLKTKPVTRQDILVEDSTWQQQQGGTDGADDDNRSMVACEGYLSIEALLDDIRARRKEVFYYEEHIPGFFYDLVSVEENIITVAICFSNRAQRQPQTRPSSIAVLVQLDVYDQSYQEIEWAQHGFCPNPERLRNRSKHFALTRRMKDMRIGPFSVETTVSDKKSSSQDWGFLLDNDDSNYPALGPVDELIAARAGKKGNAASATAVWREFVKLDAQQQQFENRFHKSIAMAALYPDCDVLSNAAVRWEVPAQKLQCRSGTTELVYGV